VLCPDRAGGTTTVTRARYRLDEATRGDGNGRRFHGAGCATATEVGRESTVRLDRESNRPLRPQTPTRTGDGLSGVEGWYAPVRVSMYIRVSFGGERGEGLT